MKWKYSLLLVVVTEVVINERSATEDIIADVPVYACMKCTVTWFFLAMSTGCFAIPWAFLMYLWNK